MTPEQFQRLEELYDAAADLSLTERNRFIDERCAGDDVLRHQLQLAFAPESGAIAGLVAETASEAYEAEQQWTGDRVGPYRVIRLLGRGGMGAVYLGVRDDDQFHKEVAIKTLSLHRRDASALSRFRHERQILANLEHPNIARLLDGGSTAQGLPYIVLEYVDGKEITAYCEEKQLSISDRLKLFQQVCDAVHHAHQNLIVHRDIKPANILVSPQGNPKLLDFGIAKLLDAGTNSQWKQTMTATGLHLMTPDYASPEQVRGESISTASDVYSLGAVLYELLSGKRPHQLKQYDVAEIVHAVCVAEIEPPSKWGDRELRGDLDNIVLKAMQKDPERRYSSVAALSDDIRRHLVGLPVAARADTAGYRAMKFIRRHRLGVTLTAALVVAIAVGSVTAIYQARLAQRRFAQVRELANTFLFDFYDQVVPLQGSTKVRAFVVETARRYLDGLAADAGNDRDLIFDLAQAYFRLGLVQGKTGGANLGQVEQARASYQRSLDLYGRAGLRPDSPEEVRRAACRLLLEWSRLELTASRGAPAEAKARQALAVLGSTVSEPASRVLYAEGELVLGQTLVNQGRPGDALAPISSAAQSVVGLRNEGYTGAGFERTFTQAQAQLARTKVFLGDLDGALEIYLEVIAQAKPCRPVEPTSLLCDDLALWQTWAGDVYAALDRPNLQELEKGAAFYRRAIEMSEQRAQVDRNDRQAQFNLAVRYGKLGDAIWMIDPQQALDLYERALGAARALVSKEQLEIIRESYLISISRPLVRLGRLAQARNALDELRRRNLAHPPTDYSDRLGNTANDLTWAQLYKAERNLGAARKQLEGIIQTLTDLRKERPSDLTPIYYLSGAYRELSALTSGEERKRFLLASAEAWRSWPATTYTRRQEERDRVAAR